jgi:hypothetical protein
MFQFQALVYWRFQRVFDRVNLHRPTFTAGSSKYATMRMGALLIEAPAGFAAAAAQGLTLVHFSAQRRLILLDTLGA